MPRDVRLLNVCLDPPHVAMPGRLRYRVTLACGCFWWEDRDADAAPPNPPICRCERHPGTISTDVLQVPVLSRQQRLRERG